MAGRALEWNHFGTFFDQFHDFSERDGEIALINGARRAKRWGDAMSSAQAQPMVESLLFGEIADRQPAAGRRFEALFASIFRRRLRVQRHAVPGFEGRGWCDSSERQILDDIAVRQAKRALI